MSVSIIKRNLAANFAGTIVTAIVSLAVVPIYLRLLGPEVYGLVGFYTVLQALFAVFDFGLGTAANRETARLSATGDSGPTLRTLVRTLEVLYGAASLVIAALVTALSPLIAVWVNPSALSDSVVRNAVIVMGLTVALQFPIGLYSGILLGLERHGVLNAWMIGGAVLRLVIPLLLFSVYGATIGVYFVWQAIAAAMLVVAIRWAVMRALPSGGRRPLDFGSVWRLRGFAAGVTGITILAAIVLQTDKVAVSRFSALGEFGYYTVAAALAGSVLLISGPVAAAVFPRFSQMAAAGHLDALTTLYHRANQFAAALLMPVAAVVALFSSDVLIAWTRDVNVATRAGAPLTFLVVALTANALAAVPYVLQLAFGWTSLAFRLNVAGVAVLVPATIYAAARAGASGAAAAVCAWHLIALTVAILFMHRRLIPGALWPWISRDVGRPLLVSVAVAGTFRVVYTAPGVLALGVLAATTLAASVAATPLTWLWLRERLSER